MVRQLCNSRESEQFRGAKNPPLGDSSVPASHGTEAGTRFTMSTALYYISYPAIMCIWNMGRSIDITIKPTISPITSIISGSRRLDITFIVSSVSLS